jgi:peptidoglycan/xylan/chitin deacetylase (PgdA/CDA1 family)
MQLPWFPKPIYRFIYLATFLALSGCGWLISSASPGWLLIFLIIILFSGSMLIGPSFIVSSGVYVMSICKGKGQCNKIALTFDDGPCEQTKQILKVLDKHRVKATFFLIGRQVALHREIVHEMIKKQHTLGNHSYDHAIWFPLMGSTRIKKELTATQTAIASISGTKPVYFRPPFGVTNPFIAKALKGLNLKTVGWSLRSFDTSEKNPEKTVQRIKHRVEPGSIVIMHDRSRDAALVLEQLLIYCREKQLVPVSLDELLSD